MKSITGKLVKIMEECSTIRKNGTNDFHNYKYATSADVLEKVNTSLVKHKVASVVVPEIIESADVVTSKGNTEHLVTVKVDIILTDAESGECLTVTGLGSGQDGGDKAVMKAQTAAIKYAYMLSLAISTSDDPEADSKTDEAGVQTASQAPGTIPVQELACSDCTAMITAGIRKVSISKYGRPLCMKCQKKAKGVA